MHEFLRTAGAVLCQNGFEGMIDEQIHTWPDLHRDGSPARRTGVFRVRTYVETYRATSAAALRFPLLRPGCSLLCV